jgi:hypothetical protein
MVFVHIHFNPKIKQNVKNSFKSFDLLMNTSSILLDNCCVIINISKLNLINDQNEDIEDWNPLFKFI